MLPLILPRQSGRDSVRIADADQLVRREDHERIGALQSQHSLLDRLFDAAGVQRREKLRDYLAVVACLKLTALRRKLGSQRGGVHQVAVVCDRNLAGAGRARKRAGRCKGCWSLW